MTKLIFLLGLIGFFSDTPKIKLFADKNETISFDDHTGGGDGHWWPNEYFTRIKLPNTNVHHLLEGENITLHCIFVAKPNATVIRWSHNHHEIWQEKAGIWIEENRMEIFNADSERHDGVYRCTVFNSEGRGVSNEIRIKVDCKLVLFIYFINSLLNVVVC